MKVSKAFLNFAENVVDSLQAVSDKIDEVQAKMDELQETIDGNGSSEPAPSEEPPMESSEEKGEVEENPPEESASEVVEEKVEETKEEPSEENKEFSEGFLIVKNITHPFGNSVIKTKDFSEKKHQKVFNRVFTTQTQAQAMMNQFSIQRKDFSNRYRAIKGLMNF